MPQQVMTWTLCPASCTSVSSPACTTRTLSDRCRAMCSTFRRILPDLTGQRLSERDGDDGFRYHYLLVQDVSHAGCLASYLRRCAGRGNQAPVYPSAELNALLQNNEHQSQVQLNLFGRLRLSLDERATKWHLLLLFLGEERAVINRPIGRH
jgi:hypothetical protein